MAAIHIGHDPLAAFLQLFASSSDASEQRGLEFTLIFLDQPAQSAVEVARLKKNTCFHEKMSKCPFFKEPMPKLLTSRGHPNQKKGPLVRRSLLLPDDHFHVITCQKTGPVGGTTQRHRIFTGKLGFSSSKGSAPCTSAISGYIYMTDQTNIHPAVWRFKTAV